MRVPASMNALEREALEFAVARVADEIREARLLYPRREPGENRSVHFRALVQDVGKKRSPGEISRVVGVCAQRTRRCPVSLQSIPQRRTFEKSLTCFKCF